MSAPTDQVRTPAHARQPSIKRVPPPIQPAADMLHRPEGHKHISSITFASTGSSSYWSPPSTANTARPMFDMVDIPNHLRPITAKSTLLWRTSPSSSSPTGVSPARTAVLLFIFCFAEFIEISSGSSVIPVLGEISKRLSIPANDVQWVLSAYAASFAAFMLLAGRISDVYSAKYVFCGGFFWAGIFSLAAGFAKSAIPLTVLRGLQGLGAACSIPSAIRLIVLLTPDRKKQGQALQLFALAGGSAATFSSLIGGGIATNIRYEWIFWLVAIAAIPSSIAAFVLIPSFLDTTSARSHRLTQREKLFQVDLLGALLVACFLILFVFSLTEGNRIGWTHARVLVPLLVGLNVVLPLFLIWEEYGRTRRGYEACLPLKLWKLDNFAVLFVATAASFYWYGAVYITLTTLWSNAYAYSAWQQAKYFLPIGIATMLQAGITPLIVAKIGARSFLACTSLIAAAGGAILANVNVENHYWSMNMPAQILVGFGAGMTYICCSQALIQTGEPAMAGVLGAIWTSALQIGLVISIAVCMALITAFDHTDLLDYRGYRAAFYSMTVVGGVLSVIVVLFLKPDKLRHVNVTSVDGETGAYDKEQELQVQSPVLMQSIPPTPTSPNSMMKVPL